MHLISFKDRGKLFSSVWVFPAIVLIVFAILVTFKLNGSSAGVYHKALFGDTIKDPDIIYGHPKSIRSDEFLIFTPRVILQTQTNFPAFNDKIGSGREVVITPEAPIKDWVGVFRPHTVAYFLLPSEHAFAFSWWFGLAALVITCYFFVLRILNSKFLAILLSISFALSPFILWWYQVVLLLSLTFFFIAALLFIRLLNGEKVKYIKSQKLSDFLHVFALIYSAATFILLLYAPFLIPVSLVLAIYAIGYVLDGLKSGTLKPDRIKTVSFYIITAMLAVLAMGVIFYFDRQNMFAIIANSVYPGDRRIASGQLPFSPLFRFFDSFLMPLLHRPPTGSFYTNQSEASNFILLLPFLLVPGIFLQFYDYKKNKQVNWIFLLLQLLAIMFILRISVPIADGFYKLFLLDRVPNNRLLLGVGLIGFLQLIYLIKYMRRLRVPKRPWLIFAIIFSFLVLFWLLIFSKYFFYEYLDFNNSFWVFGPLAAFFTSIIAAFILKKNLIGASLLLIFTLISSFYIMPIQKGLTLFEDSHITNKIKQVSAPAESWAVVDNFIFESLPLTAGRRLINGHQPYTDFEFWGQLDKEGLFENVYNRQAHALFVTNSLDSGSYWPPQFAKINNSFELVKGNVFKVKFSCSNFTYKNIDFVLTTHNLRLPCLNRIDEVVYPKTTFYIYKVKQAD